MAALTFYIAINILQRTHHILWYCTRKVQKFSLTDKHSKLQSSACLPCKLLRCPCLMQAHNSYQLHLTFDSWSQSGPRHPPPAPAGNNRERGRAVRWSSLRSSKSW